jgi:type IV pilus assembly protein PilQ
MAWLAKRAVIQIVSLILCFEKEADMFKQAIGASVVLLLLALPGCKTVEPDNQSQPAGLPRAQAFFDQGNYQDAMIECVDIARKAPGTPGLADLQNKIVKRLTEEHARVAAMRSANTHGQMSAEVDSNKVLPDTYGMRRGMQGNTAPVRTAPTSMERAMQKKVTVNLDNVNLSDFILAIGNSEGVNIISDNLDNSKTMTVHAENVPLQEILDYISRNLSISFYVGDNVIWATQRDSGQPRTPLQTRLYRLKKGISSEELGGGAGSNGTINIVAAIERFVPKTDGSDLLFDKKAHVLIVRNTRENLQKVEEIIENLDVCPPQVLIEARFIATKITDLRELGIDWILNSPLTVTEKKVLNNGVPVNTAESQINSGATAGFTPFSGSANGLNMSYEGILTDPMFKAVIHALETSDKSRTLSVPKVTTINNRAASIRIGEDFRYFEQYDVQSIPSSVNSQGSQVYSSVLVPVGTPTLEELGIELKVTPSVGSDMTSVDLTIAPQISQFERYESFEVASGNNSTTASGSTTNNTSVVRLPVFKRSKIETEMVVQSGETVVMGGLISSTEDKGVEEVPILSSIPLIGRLFKHDTVSEDKENLLIFVTATILSDRGESLVPMSEEPATAVPSVEKTAGK